MSSFAGDRDEISITVANAANAPVTIASTSASNNANVTITSPGPTPVPASGTAVLVFAVSVSQSGATLAGAPAFSLFLRPKALDSSNLWRYSSTEVRRKHSNRRTSPLRPLSLSPDSACSRFLNLFIQRFLDSDQGGQAGDRARGACDRFT